MNRIFSSYLPCISVHRFKFVNSMYIPVLIFAVITTFMFISGNEAKAQSPINCDGSLNCPMPEVWRTRNTQVAVDDACIVSISFRYTRCCAGCNYVIEILSINAANTWNGEPCAWITHDPVYYAIKLAMVEFHKLEPLADMNPITVKTNACYVFEPISLGKTKLEPCSNLCCITNYWVAVNPDYLTVTAQQTLLNGNQPMTCGFEASTYSYNPDCAPVCQGHIIDIPEQINLSDYPDVTLCDLNCYWRLDGNKNVTDQNFIGPTNGEDFVIKTLNDEWPALRGDTLMNRVHIDKNRRIDFNINTTKNLPQISFDSDPWGENGVAFPNWGDPMIKLYKATGTDEPPLPGVPDVPPYKSFPWWITISGIPGEQVPYHHQGSFNIWSCSEEPKVGEENDLMTKKFTILRNGNVGIGVVNPEHKLVVDGNIFATSIKATGNIVSGETICAKEVNIVEDPACPWPDYVFTNDYKLLSFDELEKSISENGSLPGVPNADDVKANGIELGKMQAILLQKVEELTLYVIQLNKENENLKKQLKQLQKK